MQESILMFIYKEQLLSLVAKERGYQRIRPIKQKELIEKRKNWQQLQLEGVRLQAELREQTRVTGAYLESVKEEDFAAMRKIKKPPADSMTFMRIMSLFAPVLWDEECGTSACPHCTRKFKKWFTFKKLINPGLFDRLAAIDYDMLFRRAGNEFKEAALSEWSKPENFGWAPPFVAILKWIRGVEKCNLLNAKSMPASKRIQESGREVDALSRNLVTLAKDLDALRATRDRIFMAYTDVFVHRIPVRAGYRLKSFP